MKYFVIFTVTCLIGAFALAAILDSRRLDNKIVITQNTELPNNLKIIKNLDNDWYILEGEVEGKNRKYLYRYHYQGNATTETIVEIKD